MFVTRLPRWRELMLFAALYPAAMELATAQVLVALPPPAPEALQDARVRSGAEAPQQNQIYDPDGPSYGALQKSNEALKGFPLDQRGYLDWVSAFKQGAINPRAERKTQGKMQVLQLDVVMKNTKQMPYVVFPHQTHTEWLACSNCHGGIFIAKAGANKISMGGILKGEYCGVCHGKVAFVPMLSCERCHSLPQPGTKAWW